MLVGSLAYCTYSETAAWLKLWRAGGATVQDEAALDDLRFEAIRHELPVSGTVEYEEALTSISDIAALGRRFRAQYSLAPVRLVDAPQATVVRNMEDRVVVRKRLDPETEEKK